MEQEAKEKEKEKANMSGLPVNGHPQDNSKFFLIY